MGWRCWRKLESRIKLVARIFPVTRVSYVLLRCSVGSAHVLQQTYLMSISFLCIPRIQMRVCNLWWARTHSPSMGNWILNGCARHCMIWSSLNGGYWVLGWFTILRYSKNPGHTCNVVFLFVHFPGEKSRVPCSPYLQLVNAALLIWIPDLRCPSRQIYLATETFPRDRKSVV